MNKQFVIKGTICYAKDLETIECIDGYVVCENGTSKGVYTELPKVYQSYEVIDHTGKLIIPGLIDLHMHAPQYTFTGTGMDLQLLDWLNTYTFPEEAKYRDLTYARKAYDKFVKDLLKSATTRACIFATMHTDSTLGLMQLLEDSGLKAMVGRVNMDRNSPAYLCEEDADQAAKDTEYWLLESKKRFQNITPILTPRFIPSCTDELCRKIASLRKKYQLPLQSHLSENPSEVAWVRELCADASSYINAYEQLHLLDDARTVMAHCVYSKEEIETMKKHDVYVAHCPESNLNLASGIAPIRTFLKEGLHVGLGSDVAAGSTLNLFHSMTQAIQASKMYWRLVDESCRPLSMEEVFYLATKGGGQFFGKVGSFESGYEMDAVVLDDSRIASAMELTPLQRLERILYLSDDREIIAKYVAGRKVI